MNGYVQVLDAKKLNNCMPRAKDKDLLCFVFICCPPYFTKSEFPFVPCLQQKKSIKKKKIGLPHLINTQTHLDNFCMTLTQLKSFLEITQKKKEKEGRKKSTLQLKKERRFS